MAVSSFRTLLELSRLVGNISLAQISVAFLLGDFKARFLRRHWHARSFHTNSLLEKQPRADRRSAAQGLGGNSCLLGAPTLRDQKSDASRGKALGECVEPSG